MHPDRPDADLAKRSTESLSCCSSEIYNINMAVRFYSFTLLSIALIPDAFTIRIVSFDSKMNYHPDKFDDNIIRRFYADKCPDEDGVSYSNLNLTTIPKKSIVSKHIKSVSLFGNQLTKIPVQIFADAPNIECMDLANNNILSYEMPLGSGHSQLKKLILNYQRTCGHAELFSRLGEYFPNLEVLHLNGIHREPCDPRNKLPDLSRNKHSLVRLHMLYLADNQLSDPDVILNSIMPITVRTLHLENNLISSFKVLNLNSLEELHLDGNSIRDFTLEFDRNLKKLSLRRCNLSDSSNVMLNAISLETLDLSDNMFQSSLHLSEELLGNVPNLVELALRHNKLTEVPDLQHLGELKKLSLSHNSIKTVRQVTTTSLEILSLRRNEISEIEVDAFSKHSYLKELDLSYNRLQYLPHEWSYGLTQLEFLSLRGNLFSTVAHMELPPTLKHLYVEQNSMGSIDENSIQTLPVDCNIHVA